MSVGNFKECLELVLKSEGGYVDDPRDSGGRTNLGVTQKVWEEYTGHDADEKTMRGLTPEKVAPLYEQRYWRPTYCEVLPRGLDLLVFSMGINGGPGRAVKLLQSAIGCVPDGVIGSKTMGLIKQSNVADLIAKYSNARKSYYESLKTFPIFGNGWLNRVNTEEAKAIQMAKSC
jgi:lysozyme family protein